MSRIALAACCALAVAAAAPLDAEQGRPDLSGRWALVSDPGTSPGWSSFGTTLVVSQSGDSITVEQQLVRMRFMSGASGSSTVTSETGGTMRSSYVTDGADHDLPAPAATTAPTEWAAVTASRSGTYHAVWSSQQLVIMRRDTVTLSRRNDPPLTIRRVIREAFTLAKDGTLITDSLIVADPLPSGFFFNQPDVTQEPPANVRSVYRRAQ